MAWTQRSPALVGLWRKRSLLISLAVSLPILTAASIASAKSVGIGASHSMASVAQFLPVFALPLAGKLRLAKWEGPHAHAALRLGSPQLPIRIALFGLT